MRRPPPTPPKFSDVCARGHYRGPVDSCHLCAAEDRRDEVTTHAVTAVALLVILALVAAVVFVALPRHP